MIYLVSNFLFLSSERIRGLRLQWVMSCGRRLGHGKPHFGQEWLSFFHVFSGEFNVTSGWV